jgi:hypothetical protein
MRDMARDQPTICPLFQHRCFARTKAGRYRAAGMKGAARRPVSRIGGIALKHNALSRPARMWDGGYQRTRIRMRRVVQYRIGRPFFHNAAEIHDRDAVAYLPNSTQIMAHEKHGRAELFLKIKKQIHRLRLDGNIKRADRLIAHKQGRISRQGARENSALPLPARKLMRVAQTLVRPEPHCTQQGFDAARPLRGTADTMDFQWFCDLGRDRQSAIQCSQRVLKHHLHACAKPSPSRAARFGHHGAFKADAPRIRRFHAKHKPARGGFPAARFTNQAKGASPFKPERDAIHSAHFNRSAKKPTPHFITTHKALSFQQNAAGLHAGTLSNCAAACVTLMQAAR